MGRALAIITVLLGGTGVLVGSAFVAQNSLRTTQLSLNLKFAAWELAEPVSVMALMGGAFAVGLLLGSGFFMWRNWGVKAQVRDLKRQLAVTDAGGF
ncbi:MAG: LapA family protein [Proteobacteria bacterium]|nr:LapA family protein [Pseudomonadota bacterium]